MDTSNAPDEPIHDEEAVLQTWRKLCGCFSGIRYVANRPQDTWPLFKRNYVGDVTISWKLSYWKKAKALLIPLADAEVDYLRSLAQQRLEFAASQFRSWAVMSVSLPVSFLVLANQFSPAWVREEIFNGSTDSIPTPIFVLIILAGANLLYIFLNVVKAREMRTALELEAASRRLRRGETIVSAGGDTTDLSL